MNWVSRSSILFIFSFTASWQLAACPKGQLAFEAGVYQLLKSNCRYCHTGTHSAAPRYYYSDAQQTRLAVLNYVNFDQIHHSKIVHQAGNGHCGSSSCTAKVGERMKSEIASWFANGEAECLGETLTDAITIPDELPATVAIPLGSLGEAFSELSLTAEIAWFTEQEGSLDSSYHISEIRLKGPGPAIKIKALFPVLNGVRRQRANHFADIKAHVSPTRTGSNLYPVLSSRSMILPTSQKSGNSLKWELEVELAELSPSCHDFTGFRRRITQDLNRCGSCHGAGGGAQEKLDLSGEMEAQCRNLSQALTTSFVAISPLMTYPARGYRGHPVVLPVSRLKDWMRWSETKEF